MGLGDAIISFKQAVRALRKIERAGIPHLEEKHYSNRDYDLPDMCAIGHNGDDPCDKCNYDKIESEGDVIKF